MRQLDNYLNKYPDRAFFLLIVLACPAFFTNLGLLPLFADEPTRANVSLEMILSKNFAVPTVGGEYYYNKPPFYNWILSGFYLLTGSYSEFVTRLPALIPMFLFSITIYYSVNYFLKDKRIAALSGISFLVNGQIMFYNSMLGHIDIFYSWLTYSSFMLIFYFYQRKQWFLLFFISYFITAITFLCKGLPSILFQGSAIIALLTYTRNFKQFFSWQHLISLLICLLIIGSYFFNYYQYNPDLKSYFSTILDQSTQRTAVKVNLWQVMQHILFFPFEHLGNLFPVSLLMLFTIHRNFFRGLMQNQFLKFITIIFIANIWIYWLSPQTRPRYLLMLYPLLFIIWSHAYYTYKDKFQRLNKIFGVILVVMALIVTTCIPAAFFAGLQKYVPYLSFKIAVVFTCCLFFSWLIWHLKSQKIIAFMGLLLISRCVPSVDPSSTKITS